MAVFIIDLAALANLEYKIQFDRLIMTLVGLFYNLNVDLCRRVNLAVSGSSLMLISLSS